MPDHKAVHLIFDEVVARTRRVGNERPILAFESRSSADKQRLSLRGTPLNVNLAEAQQTFNEIACTNLMSPFRFAPDYRSIDGHNDPIDEVVPGRCMAEGQPGGGHGGDDEKKAPEISGVNATLGNQVVDRTGKQEGEDRGGDREGAQMDQG